jgi:very-short-patch-repair endonuclease
MGRSVAQKVAARAAAQHGLITYAQGMRCGLAEDALRRWAQAGRAERVRAGVYRLSGAPDTWEQRLLALALSTGGVASHRAAARLWGLGDWPELEVTVRGAGRRRGRGEVHRSADLAERHVTVRGGIPVTHPMRTLVDLGAVLGRPAVEDALEQALIARVCSVVAVERVLDDVACKGRAGAGVIRAVLDERALGRARPDGLVEARMARLLREHGLPEPRFQYRVGRFKLDFAYPEVRLALEVDGFEAHGSPRAMQHDLERQNRLVNLGWTVLRFTWLDVVQRPEWVAATVALALAGRASA